MSSKDVSAWLRELRQTEGVTISRGKRNSHWKIYLDGRLVTVLPATTSKGRGFANARADFARALRQRGERNANDR